MSNIRQIQGEPVKVDWTIGRAPLALRGIRFADGDGADGDGAAAAAAATAAAATAAAAAAAGAKPAPPQIVTAPDRPAADWYHPDYVKGVRDEAQANREAKEAAIASHGTEKARADAAEARIAAFEAKEAEAARAGQIATAAKDIANVDALTDSQAFATAIKDVDVADPAKLAAAITEFVGKNPRFAIAGQPGAKRQHGAPMGGGHTTAPTTLGGALNAHYAR